MFSFFKRKKNQTPTEVVDSSVPASPEAKESPAQPTPEAPAQVESSSAIPVPAVTPAPEPTTAQSPAPGATQVAQAIPVASASAPAPVSEPVPAAEPLAPVAQPQAAPLQPAFKANEPVAQVEPVATVSSEPVVVSKPDAEPASVAPEPAPAPKRSWLARLKEGLSRTGQTLGGLFVGVKVDENLFEELETALIMADAGLEATDKLLTALRARVRKERLDDPAKVKAALRDILADHLKPLEKTFPLGTAKPLVIMIAGVNGAGKTTSIGKLANHFQTQGAKVLLAAGDTFRAAAREQLIEWGARNNVTVIAQEGGDPAAVAFDAVNAGRARDAGVVMVDTAGRLPTQLHLMEELKKIRRVIGKAEGAAPHEVLLVVDGNTGQNAIAQIKAFDAAIKLTGLVVTKLDGTAKGGTLAAVAAGSQGVRPVPVYWIGVGEGLNDLQPFVAREFATALLGD